MFIWCCRSLVLASTLCMCICMCLRTTFFLFSLIIMQCVNLNLIPAINSIYLLIETNEFIVWTLANTMFKWEIIRSSINFYVGKLACVCVRVFMASLPFFPFGTMSITWFESRHFALTDKRNIITNVCESKATTITHSHNSIALRKFDIVCLRARHQIVMSKPQIKYINIQTTKALNYLFVLSSNLQVNQIGQSDRLRNNVSKHFIKNLKCVQKWTWKWACKNHWFAWF